MKIPRLEKIKRRAQAKARRDRAIAKIGVAAGGGYSMCRCDDVEHDASGDLIAVHCPIHDQPIPE